MTQRPLGYSKIDCLGPRACSGRRYGGVQMAGVNSSTNPAETGEDERGWARGGCHGGYPPRLVTTRDRRASKYSS